MAHRDVLVGLWPGTLGRHPTAPPVEPGTQGRRRPGRPRRRPGRLSPIDYSQRIPNNVDLANDRRLQRALEGWQPKFLDWWKSLGPAIPTQDVYLRTAIAVGRDGWAHFDRVPMQDYRWGIFLAERDPERRIAFGKHKGELAWQTVPGEYRAELQRLIVIQGDTEPASVEQQRHLGATAPSLYDMRNLFQVNVEEGRHLWAMVYLLHAYFGREGREEAEQLLKRNSGDVDAPRILGAFNEDTTDWLQFFMFTYFTDRDGKYQLGTLKESGFDPLARTCEFMLKEEAHHMFVGTTGVQRVVERTAALMAEHGTDDVFPHGGIPLDVDPEVPQLPVRGLDGPVRLRAVHQRRQLLHLRAQGPLERDPAQGRPRPARPDARDERRRDGELVQQDRPAARRAQPRPARRVRRRLRERRPALEPGARGRRPRAAADAAARGLLPQGRGVRRRRHHARRAR